MKESVEKVKKVVLLVIIVTSTLMLSGCVEEVELDEKLIVALVGIDMVDTDKYRITMGLINTRSIEEKEARGVEFYSVEGYSIFEAVRSSILKLGKQPQWPYIKVIVFGPAFSEKEIVPVLDFFNRNNEVQPNPYITFSNVLAEEIVKLETKIANIPAVVVEGQFRLQNLVGYAPEIQLHQFTEMMLTPEKVGYAEIIKKEKVEDTYAPKIEGTAVIKEGKWIGDLSRVETRGLKWVRKEVEGGIIVILLCRKCLLKCYFIEE